MVVYYLSLLSGPPFWAWKPLRELPVSISMVTGGWHQSEDRTFSFRCAGRSRKLGQQPLSGARQVKTSSLTRGERHGIGSVAGDLSMGKHCRSQEVWSPHHSTQCLVSSISMNQQPGSLLSWGLCWRDIRSKQGNKCIRSHQVRISILKIIKTRQRSQGRQPYRCVEWSGKESLQS